MSKDFIDKLMVSLTRKKFCDMEKARKEGNIGILCGGRTSGRTYDHFMKIYAHAKLNGYTDIKVHFIDPHIDELEKENKHQKKVIDRLSRKIQKLTKKHIINDKFKEMLCFNMPDDVAIICMIKADYERNKSEYATFENLKSKNEFLMKRENKLQLIEQMFKSGTVDLKELNKIVMKEVKE